MHGGYICFYYLGHENNIGKQIDNENLVKELHKTFEWRDILFPSYFCIVETTLNVYFPIDTQQREKVFCLKKYMIEIIEN